METTKTDMEKFQGKPGFLIPVEVLSNNVEILGTGSVVQLALTGHIVEIGDRRFVFCDVWKPYQR